ncbi:unnamed protein product, partial [Musa hybrid cultivar]
MPPESPPFLAFPPHLFLSSSSLSLFISLSSSSSSFAPPPTLSIDLHWNSSREVRACSELVSSSVFVPVLFPPLFSQTLAPRSARRRRE